MNKPHSLDIGSDLYFMSLVILNLLPISAYSAVLKFDMKIFVNVARLEIASCLLKARGGGIRVLWTHF